MWTWIYVACPGNHGSPGWRHWFVFESGTIGPKNMRHRSSIIVTSIAAPKASTATLGKSHWFPGSSSILQWRISPSIKSQKSPIYYPKRTSVSIFCQLESVEYTPTFQTDFWIQECSITVQHMSYSSKFYRHLNLQ